MKMKGPHIVPLSRQCFHILWDIPTATGCPSRYVFPGVRTPTRPMSENTVYAALRFMGYGKEQMTGRRIPVNGIDLAERTRMEP